MRIDRRELGRHYSSLTDEELLSMRRDDLTSTAQVIYDFGDCSPGLGEKPADEEEIEKSDKVSKASMNCWIVSARNRNGWIMLYVSAPSIYRRGAMRWKRLL